VRDDTEHDTTSDGDEPAAPPPGRTVRRPVRQAVERRAVEQPRHIAFPGSLIRVIASRARPGDVAVSVFSSPPVRRALRSRVLALLVAAVVATTVAGRVGAADRTAEQWGEQVTVAVMTRDLPAGSTITSSDARLVRWPAALVPADALRHLPEQGRLAAAAVDGEVLVGSRLADGSPGELSAQLTRGEVAIQLPLSDIAPNVAPGDRVDVVAPTTGAVSDLSVVASTLQVEVVASAARVISADDGVVSLAVRRPQAERTAGAALSGVVALVVLGGS